MGREKLPHDNGSEHELPVSAAISQYSRNICAYGDMQFPAT